jgi:hypothetical protein
MQELLIAVAHHLSIGRIWPIFRAVVVAGDTYAYPPDINEADAEESWMQDGSDRSIIAILR